MLTRDGKEVVTETAALAVEQDFYTVTSPAGDKVSVVEEELLRLEMAAALRFTLAF